MIWRVKKSQSRPLSLLTPPICNLDFDLEFSGMSRSYLVPTQGKQSATGSSSLQAFTSSSHPVSETVAFSNIPAGTQKKKEAKTVTPVDKMSAAETVQQSEKQSVSRS